MTDPISPDLKTVMRRLRRGKLLDTLPERLALARQQKVAHQDTSASRAIAHGAPRRAPHGELLTASIDDVETAARCRTLLSLHDRAQVGCLRSIGDVDHPVSSMRSTRSVPSR
jgi:hypothetical protein